MVEENQVIRGSSVIDADTMAILCTYMCRRGKLEQAHFLCPVFPR